MGRADALDGRAVVGGAGSAGISSSFIVVSVADFVLVIREV